MSSRQCLLHARPSRVLRVRGVRRAGGRRACLECWTRTPGGVLSSPPMRLAFAAKRPRSRAGAHMTPMAPTNPPPVTNTVDPRTTPPTRERPLRPEDDPGSAKTSSSTRNPPHSGGFGADEVVFGRPTPTEYDLAAPSTTSSARARPRRAETDHRITTTTQTATPIKHEEPLHTPVASRGAQCYAPWVSKADSEMRRTRRRRAYAGATRMRGCGHTCRRADEPVPPASTPHIHASRRPRRHRQPQRIRECQRP